MNESSKGNTGAERTPVRCFARHALMAFLASAAAWLPGCAMIYDAVTDPKEKPVPIVGRPLSALTWVRQIELHDGKLLASVSGDWWGIAVIDTSADTVTSLLQPFTFDGSYIAPWSIAPYQDSLLYATHPYMGVTRVLGPSGTWLDVQTPSPTSSNLRSLQPTSGELLLFDRYGRDIRSVTGQSSVLRLRLPKVEYLMGVAMSGSRLLVARYNSRDLFVANASSGAVIDSIRFDSLPGRPNLRRFPEQIVAHAGRIFVSLFVSDTAGRPDTSIVAVFDSATLALDTVLKLNYTHRSQDSEYPFAPRVVDGKWYLPGFNPAVFGEAGVEVIDLNAVARLPEVAAAWDFGGQRIHAFLPAGNGKAYAILDASGYRKIQRVSY